MLGLIAIKNHNFQFGQLKSKPVLDQEMDLFKWDYFYNFQILDKKNSSKNISYLVWSL